MCVCKTKWKLFYSYIRITLIEFSTEVRSHGFPVLDVLRSLSDNNLIMASSELKSRKTYSRKKMLAHTVRFICCQGDDHTPTDCMGKIM